MVTDSDIEGQGQDADGGEESTDLVTIRKYQELLDASLAKSSLESAGMECFLKDEYTIGHVVQVSLQVRQADVEAAKGILDQPIPESFEVEGVGSFQQPRCPECGSLDVNAEDWMQSGKDPFWTRPHQEFIWTCQACKHQFPDTKVEP